MFEKGEIYSVYVKPKSSQREIILADPLVIRVISAPENDKANKEVVWLFKKKFGVKVSIVSGLKSRHKKVLIV